MLGGAIKVRMQMMVVHVRVKNFFVAFFNHDLGRLLSEWTRDSILSVCRKFIAKVGRCCPFELTIRLLKAIILNLLPTHHSFKPSQSPDTKHLSASHYTNELLMSQRLILSNIGT